LALLIALLCVFAAVIIATRMQLEASRQAEAHHNVSRVLRTLQGELDHMDLSVQDWAAWDDTYEFVRTRDDAYVQDNLLPDILPQLGLDFMAIVDAGGTPVWSRVDSALSQAEGSAPDRITAQVADSDLVKFNSPSDDNRRAVVQFGSVSVLVSAHPITTSSGEGPVRGTFLMGVALTPTKVAQLGELADSSFAVISPGDSRLPEGIGDANRLPAEGKRPLAEIGAILDIAGYGVLTDGAGAPVAYIVSPAEQSNAAATSRTIAALMAALFIVGIGWGGITLGVIEGASLSRVSWLRREVSSITSSEASRISINGEAPHDEIWAVAVDVNAMLDALEESRRVFDETQEFFAKASHELRTPLNSIIGFGSLLSRGIAGPLNEEQQRQADMVLASGKRLLALTNDLLEVEKLSAEQIPLELSDCDIDETVGRCLELIRPLAEEKSLELRVDLGHVGTVPADTRRIEQAVLNLLGNAIKFTDEGFVGIRTAVGNDVVTVEVADSGRGIGPDLLPHVFEEFVSGENRSIGTGLGLAITKQIALRHGGTVTVSSEKGVGSRFELQLPRVASI
jgi:signal transduction histidine kinase